MVRGPHKRYDWQACAASPQDNTLLPLPLPGWQMGFLCWGTLSLSPLRLRREKGWARLNTSCEIWRGVKKKVYSERSLTLITQTVSHGLLTLCSTPVLSFRLEHELTWAETAGQSLWRPVYDWVIIILRSATQDAYVLWLPALWKVCVIDSKPTRAGQETARMQVLQLKCPLFCFSLFFLSWSRSVSVAISAAHPSHSECWASAKTNGWHHSLCMSPIQLGSHSRMCSSRRD